MRDKYAHELKALLFVYNGFQVFLSAYMFYELVASSYLAGYDLTCQTVDYSMDPLALRVSNYNSDHVTLNIIPF